MRKNPVFTTNFLKWTLQEAHSVRITQRASSANQHFRTGQPAKRTFQMLNQQLHKMNMTNIAISKSSKESSCPCLWVTKKEDLIFTTSSKYRQNKCDHWIRKGIESFQITFCPKFLAFIKRNWKRRQSISSSSSRWVATLFCGIKGFPAPIWIVWLWLFHIFSIWGTSTLRTVVCRTSKLLSWCRPAMACSRLLSSILGRIRLEENLWLRFKTGIYRKELKSSVWQGWWSPRYLLFWSSTSSKNIENSNSWIYQASRWATKVPNL